MGSCSVFYLFFGLICDREVLFLFFLVNFGGVCLGWQACQWCFPIRLGVRFLVCVRRKRGSVCLGLIQYKFFIVWRVVIFMGGPNPLCCFNELLSGVRDIAFV